MANSSFSTIRFYLVHNGNAVQALFQKLYLNAKNIARVLSATTLQCLSKRK